MATISTAIQLNDMMTAPLRNITSAMNMMLSSWSDLESATASGLSSGDIDAMRTKLNQASMAIDDMEANMRQFDQTVQKSTKSTDFLTNKLTGAVGAIGGLAAVKKIIGISDEFSGITARLNMVNDGMQDTDELIKRVMASARRSRAEFSSVADTVAKLSLNAGKVFANNKETIAFAETLNKLYGIAGTDAQSMAGASQQLVQALGSGALRGDEFNSIAEAAPPIMQRIADYMGLPKEQLRAIAAEGKITADIVKNALLSSAQEIDQQFQEMPMTWAQVWTEVMNSLYYASIPALKAINFLANHWSFIGPMAIAAAGAVGFYVVTVHGAAFATGLWAKAQATLNVIMLANPVVWLIMKIILLIGLFYVVIAVINKITGQNISATGIIIGTVSALFSFLWNIVAAFISFFSNVWFHPIESIARLFADLADVVLSILQLIARGIDAVFGSNLQSSVEGWRSSLKGMIDDKFGERVDFKMDSMEAFDKGYKFADKISGAFGIGLEDTYGLGDLGSNVEAIAGDTGDISNAMDITSEDLKYLRDIAEQETINRFTTAEIRVDMGGVTNQVSQNTDVDGVMDYMVVGIRDAMERVAEGVHS